MSVRRLLIGLLVLIALIGSASATAVYNATEDRIYVSGTETIHSIWSQVGDQTGKFWKDANGVYHFNNTTILLDEGSTLVFNDTAISIDKAYTIISLNATGAGTTRLEFNNVSIDYTFSSTATKPFIYSLVAGTENEIILRDVTINTSTIQASGIAYFVNAYGINANVTVEITNLTLLDDPSPTSYSIFYFNWGALLGNCTMNMTNIHLGNGSVLYADCPSTQCVVNLDTVVSDGGAIQGYIGNPFYLTNLSGVFGVIDFEPSGDVHISNSNITIIDVPAFVSAWGTAGYIGLSGKNISLNNVTIHDKTDFSTGFPTGTGLWFANLTMEDSKVIIEDKTFDLWVNSWAKIKNSEIIAKNGTKIQDDLRSSSKITIEFTNSKMYSPLIDLDEGAGNKWFILVNPDFTSDVLVADKIGGAEPENVTIWMIDGTLMSSDNGTVEITPNGVNVTIATGPATVKQYDNLKMVALQGTAVVENVTNYKVGERYTFSINSTNPDIEMTFTGLNPYSKVKLYYTKNNTTNFLGEFPADVNGVAKAIYDKGFSTVYFDGQVEKGQAPSEEPTKTPTPFVPPFTPPEKHETLNIIYALVIVVAAVGIIVLLVKK